MAENDKPDNVHEGLMTGSVENWTPKDPRTIPPNEPRPLETSDTKHLFGTFSD